MDDRPAKTAAPRRVWRISSQKSRPPLKLAGKSPKLMVLGERPLVVQTPESLLDDDTTPTALMFIRNNGRIPARTSDPDNWTFKVDGEVENPLSLTLADLKTKFDLESMPVRAIITRPADRTVFGPGTRTIELRGAAWAGDYRVRQVEISIDRGATWQAAALQAPKNRHDWQRWTAVIDVPAGARSLDIWARGTDELGRTQPLAVEDWNPHGVGGNPVHRIAIKLRD